MRTKFNTPTRIISTGSALFLSGVLLTGCGADNSFYVSESNPGRVSAGTIPAGTNFRSTPRVIEDGSSGDDNLCATTEKDIKISPSKVLVNPGDANGEFIGFDASDLPQNIQDDCEDSSGKVWVAENQVRATVFLTA